MPASQAEPPQPAAPPPGVDFFAQTRWSRVLRAAGSSDVAADEALNDLCRDYWYPLYAFARRRGCAPEDAADHVQEFFARLIERRMLSVADPQRGRFRTFLLTCFQRHLASHARWEHALKRGGNQLILSLDERDAEDRYLHEPADSITPEHQYDRAWALALLARAYAAMRAREVAAGRGPLFDALWPSINGGQDNPEAYVDLARRFQMTEGAVKTRAHRLRNLFRECLLGEVAETVAQPAEVEEELRALLAAVAR